jgi:predicted RNase H-like HicB family nuclease
MLLFLTGLLVVLALPVSALATLELLARAGPAAHGLTVEPMVIADAWSTVGSVAAVVAAGAALVTIWFARDTVTEARAERREASEAHIEEMRQQAQLLEATREAHEREMAERAKALRSELVMQRLAQLDRIADLLRETAHIAGDEEVHPPIRPDLGSPFTLSRLPGMLARVEAAVIILVALGGPPLDAAMQLATEDRMLGTPPRKVISDAMTALQALNSLVKHHAALILPTGR